MSKVTINKEWAELISYMKGNGADFSEALHYYLNRTVVNDNYKDISYDDMSVEKFSRAYLNGYIVEQSPKDIVEEKYKELSKDINMTVYHVVDSPINRALGFLAGVEYVNNVMKLGLKLD